MTETLRPAFADRPRPLLSYGIPFSSSAAHHITDLFHASKIYILCSASLARDTDALDRLTRALGPDKIAGTRIGMQSHTLWSEVLEVVRDAQAVEADLLITLGGGSLTDAAKVVALAISNNTTTPSTLLTLTSEPPTPNPPIKPPSIPIISIPTSLSAGEYSSFAGATHDTSRRKYSFGAPIRGPQLVILDPELTATTPERIWLGTGIRAVDHCVETYLSSGVGSKDGVTEETDRLALHALGLLVPGLVKCRLNNKDGIDADGDGGKAARLDCALGSVDAMAACSAGLPLGASHGIGHQLGPFGVPHGETSCILLPAVCKYNAKHSSSSNSDVFPRQTKLRDFLLRQEGVAGVVRKYYADAAVDLGDVLDAVIRELGLPRSLQAVGVGRDQFDALAEHSLHDRWCQANVVPLQEKGQVLEILETVA
ncbi:alcohol dehydrogenase [Aspergillus niger ATCC 1015]|uniref:Alcohol dehydrogenase n=1 Tax=Aspergillus niger (strain ATCC 1015 / CBS 113.46 / FGSC A1144 / LSHB Ac4 / NCTC 3858a / NRRL 328 / USDA 3528.7) TaxID=380704 RepID=G3YEG2_ASPNA|nr:alcohol dehydrogenase [Aspergillus niger ATCC 1015]KAI2828280.1 hypothetical protein CBS133816_5653 [Aspergillus niger]KAI2946120.1 hypothetical protein CBS147321_3503 [Aspergillus niger]KAI3001094.1 hypothetical protein CBS147346_6637 [Aspergillus niger]KAI3018086.1 hypothetical protein CBS147345_4341 [Aspergillus niger]